eukprot:763300-Hanusia_phi.AAC.1
MAFFRTSAALGCRMPRALSVELLLAPASAPAPAAPNQRPLPCQGWGTFLNFLAERSYKSGPFLCAGR